ncbi:hypothetical protein NKH77_39515 [Streptomyces sp. M19]
MTTDDVSRSTEARRRAYPPGRIDFSLMYFAHDAFTRDLRRMADAAATDAPTTRPCAPGGRPSSGNCTCTTWPRTTPSGPRCGRRSPLPTRWP